MGYIKTVALKDGYTCRSTQRWLAYRMVLVVPVYCWPPLRICDRPGIHITRVKQGCGYTRPHAEVDVGRSIARFVDTDVNLP